MCRWGSTFRRGYIDNVSLGGSWVKVLEDLGSFRGAAWKLEEDDSVDTDITHSRPYVHVFKMFVHLLPSLFEMM